MITFKKYSYKQVYTEHIIIDNIFYTSHFKLLKLCLKNK